MTKYFLPFVELGREICPGMLEPVNGYIDLPTTPGLGIDLDEEVLARHPGKPFPLRALRFPKDEGP